MSGIVGIVNLDGTPVDRQLLQQMTQFMAYRGPDDRQIWVDGHVGFGHAMLRTTIESAKEQQPCSLDDRVWLTADARIDGRAELIQILKSKGRPALEGATDAELILHAYHVWGENCSNYLLGDFALAIWDGRQQRLFCARDHFGIKPFYYATVGNSLIFSNTLNCVRLHPNVSDNLNDLAIADFLIFGYNQEVDTTTFADIARLPAAHYLTYSKAGLNLNRYFSLPIDGNIRYKKPQEYVEHFKALMRLAVGDRLRTDRVGIFMSGGLDSTTIAAVACELLPQQPVPFGLKAYTVVSDGLPLDEERYYSGLMAEHLGIPIHYLDADSYKLYERWDEPQLQRPEPTDLSQLAISLEQFKRVAAYSRIAFNGNGGDPVLYCWGSYFYFVHLLKKFQWGNLLAEMMQYVIAHGRLPDPGIRARVKRWLGIRPWQPPYPKWISLELSERLDLRSRWEKLNGEKPLIHPVRPEAYQQLTAPLWSLLFENCDPGLTGFPVEVRYPFFDLRLVKYLLAIPPVPWFLHKELVREAMQGILPELVRLRPKTPLAGDPLCLLLQQPQSQWVNHFEATPALAKYVRRDAVPPVCGIEADANEAWINLRPLNLNHWLQQLQAINLKSTKEERYEFRA